MKSFFLLTLIFAATTIAYAQSGFCSSSSYPTPDGATYMLCPINLGVNTTLTDNRVTERDCVCYNNAFLVSGNDGSQQCIGQNVDCNTMKCYRRRRIAEIEVYGPYASSPGQDCSDMKGYLKNASQTALSMCYGNVCSAQNTSTCLDADIRAACENITLLYAYWQYNDDKTALRNLPAIPVKQTKFVPVQEFRRLRNELTAILNVHESEFMLLFPVDNYVVIMVTVTSPTNVALPGVDGSRMSILSRLQANQEWIDANFRQPRPAYCNAIVETLPPANYITDCPKASQINDAIQQCEVSYCSCLGYVGGIANCSIPLGSTIYQECAQQSLDCKFKKGLALGVGSATCKPLINFMMAPNTIENSCLVDACELDDVTVLSEQNVRDLCSNLKAYSQQVTLQNPTCSNTSLPAMTLFNVTVSSCVATVDFAAYAERKAICDRAVCTCRGGTPEVMDAGDISCSNETRDCGTMTCTEVHYTCYMDMYSKYTSNTSPECVTMAQQMSSINQYDCYAIACNHANTKGCLDERYVEDCDAFTTMGSRFAAARNGDSTSVTRLKTYVNMTKQTVDQYKTMKQSIATILNVSLNDFSVLVFNEFEIVISVWEPHNQYYNDPVSVASLVSSNADFSGTYLKVPSPAFCSTIPFVPNPDNAPDCEQGGLNAGAVLAAQNQCYSDYCTCVGGTNSSTTPLCDVPLSSCGTKNDNCTLLQFQCVVKNVMPLYRQSQKCFSMYDFLMNASTVGRTCLKDACNSMTANTCGENSVKSTCSVVQQAAATIPTPAPTEPAVCDHVPHTEVDLAVLECAQQVQSLDIIDDRYNLCVEETCECRNGNIIKGASKFDECDDSVDDCGTMNCTTTNVVCLMEMFAPHAFMSQALECISLKNAMIGFGRQQCTTMFCNDDNTSTCTQSEFDLACENIVDMNLGFAAYLDPKGDAVRITTTLYALSLNASEHEDMKVELQGIINVKEEGFALIFTKDKEFTVIVYDPLPFVNSLPALATTAAITSAITGNATFMSRWVNRQGVTPPQTIVPTPEPTVIPTPSAWCVGRPINVNDPRDDQCGNNQTLWDRYVQALDNCTAAASQCSDTCGTTSQCYVSAVSCWFDAQAILLEANNAECNALYLRETDGDVVFTRCMSYSCNTPAHSGFKACSEADAAKMCNSMVKTAEGFCRKPMNSICSDRLAPLTDEELRAPIVNSVDLTKSLYECAASVGRAKNVSKCFEEQCSCMEGQYSNGVCQYAQAHCGNLMCKRNFVVCVYEEFAPYLSSQTLDCDEARRQLGYAREHTCELEICMDDEDRFCSDDNINYICDTFGNIFNGLMSVSLGPATIDGVEYSLFSELAAAAITREDVNLIKDSASQILNVRKENIVVTMFKDQNVTVSIIQADVDSITMPANMTAAFYANNDFISNFTSFGHLSRSCSGVASPMADNETCLYQMDSLQDDLKGCKISYCNCLGAGNVSDCSIGVDDCYASYPVCLRQRMTCEQNVILNDLVKYNVSCPDEVELRNNASNNYLECLQDICDDEIESNNCAMEVHKQACSYAVGLTNNKTIPVPPQPKYSLLQPLPDAPASVPELAALEDKMKACFANTSRLDEFWDFRRSIRVCTYFYEKCIDILLNNTLTSCPQRTTIDVVQAMECWERRSQCFFETSNPRLAEIKCEDNLLPAYMNPDLQFKDCVESYKMDGLFKTMTESQRQTSCTEVKYMASAWQQNIQEVAMNSSLPVRSWTAEMIRSLKGDLSAKTNIVPDDILVFVRSGTGNGTASRVTISIKPNPQKVSQTSPSTTTPNDILTLLRSNPIANTTYGLGAPIVIDPVSTAAPASGEANKPNQAGLIVGVVLGSITLVALLWFLRRRHIQNKYVITDQEMLMHSTADYRNV